MAKIRQLSSTYQNAPTTITRPGISAAGLGNGLQIAAETFSASVGIKDQYNLQLSQAQASRAGWELTDWRNNFLINMNSPEKLKEYFTGTPFEDIISSVQNKSELLDSTYAQTLYRKAAETASSGIADEGYRNQWLTEAMLQWETIEPDYQNSANAVYQEEARAIGLSNLTSQWKGGASTDTIDFRSSLDNMVAQGLIDITQGEDILLNYQKAEETVLVEQQIQAAIMPRDANGDGVTDFLKSEEAMNIAINGAIQGMDGINYLSSAEIEKISEVQGEKAMNYTALYEQYKSEGREQYYADKWAEVQSILTAPISEADRAMMAQEASSNLIMQMGTEIPEYYTGHGDIPVISRGMQDTDELNKIINKLNGIVVNGGRDIQTNASVLPQVLRIVNSPGLSPSMKTNALETLYQAGEMSSSDFEQYGNMVNNKTGETYDRVYTALASTINTEGWAEADVAKLDGQIVNFFESAGGLSRSQVEAGAKSIIKDFVADNSTVMSIVDNWQEAGQNIWNQSFRTRLNLGISGDNVAITSELMSLQDNIERGNFAGLVTKEPELFSEYAAASDLNFRTTWTGGKIEYVGPKLVEDEDGPVVVASVVDPMGNPLIAVPLEDQSGREPGTIEVRVFQPMLDRRGDGYRGEDLSSARRRMRYVQITDQPHFFLSMLEEEGQAAPVILNRENVNTLNFGAERLILSSDGSTMSTNRGTAKMLQAISIDPNYINTGR